MCWTREGLRTRMDPGMSVGEALGFDAALRIPFLQGNTGDAAAEEEGLVTEEGGGACGNTVRDSYTNGVAYFSPGLAQ